MAFLIVCPRPGFTLADHSARYAAAQRRRAHTEPQIAAVDYTRKREWPGSVFERQAARAGNRSAPRLAFTGSLPGREAGRREENQGWGGDECAPFRVEA